MSWKLARFWTTKETWLCIFKVTIKQLKIVILKLIYQQKVVKIITVLLHWHYFIPQFNHNELNKSKGVICNVKFEAASLRNFSFPLITYYFSLNFLFSFPSTSFSISLRFSSNLTFHKIIFSDCFPFLLSICLFPYFHFYITFYLNIRISLFLTLFFHS